MKQRLIIWRAGLALIGFMTGTAAWSAALAPGQVEIELHPSHVAQRREVVLGDVAYLRSTDLPLMRRLLALPLGQAPHSGAPTTLEQSTLTRWIRSHAGLTDERIIWKGAQRSVVSSAVQRVDGALIERTARQALGHWLAARASRYSLISTSELAPFTLPPGRVDFTARSLPEGTPVGSRMLVWVDVQVDGAFVRAVPVSFEVQVAAPWHALNALNAVNAANTVTTDGAADRHALAPPAAVERGDWVRLHLKSGDMLLASRAQALHSGKLGQLVQVRVAGATGAIPARVVAPGQVEALP